MVRIHLPDVRRLIAAALAMLLVLTGGCATYGEKVAPVPLPETSPQAVTVDGARVVAQAYMDPQQAKDALGFDARGAGLIPVRFVIDNQSPGVVRLRPDQTFLLDQEGNAWPLLTSEQAYRRVRAHVGPGETITGAGETTLLGGAAGAVAGLAIGVLTGSNVAESVGKGAVVGGAAGAIGGGAGRYQELDREIREDLEQKGLKLQRVPAGELAYGYLFFPGKDEAKSARSLRLSLDVNGTARVVELPL
ncbi:MAG TPA: hypothetical protein VKA55_05820 [Gammaproteobacteria bacterium]|nr:hypothetical protein [Gammaproteobacteria bacterium]